MEIFVQLSILAIPRYMQHRRTLRQTLGHTDLPKLITDTEPDGKTLNFILQIWEYSHNLSVFKTHTTSI